MNYKFPHQLAFYFLLIIIFTACQKQEFDPAPKPSFDLHQADDLSDEEYEIYSVIINERYHTDKIIINQRTIKSGYLFYSYHEYVYENQDIDSNLIKKHNTINNTFNYFANNFQNDDHEIILVTDDELDFIFSQQDYDEPNSGWLYFYHYFPYSGGVIRFSRVAMNEDKTQAILETESVSGSLSGTGLFIYLEKTDNKWTIIKEGLTWVS